MQRKVDTLFDRHHQQVRWSHSLLRGFMKTIDQPLIVVCLHYGYGFYIPPLPMHHQKIRWSHPPLWGFIKTIDWSVECHPNCMHVIIQPLIVVCLHYRYGFYISPFSSWDSTPAYHHIYKQETGSLPTTATLLSFGSAGIPPQSLWRRRFEPYQN